MCVSLSWRMSIVVDCLLFWWVINVEVLCFACALESFPALDSLKLLGKRMSCRALTLAETLGRGLVSLFAY